MRFRRRLDSLSAPVELSFRASSKRILGGTRDTGKTQATKVPIRGVNERQTRPDATRNGARDARRSHTADAYAL
jgi:hypothetical protein